LLSSFCPIKAKAKSQNKLREEDIAKIVATWSARKDIPKYAHLATPEELKANEFNLNISLYVDTFEEEAPIDLDAVRAEIAKLDTELATTRARLAQALKELGA